MQTENQIMKYIYDWLVGLDIGEVFQDRKPYDDTTKQRSKRGYIVFTFNDGIEDMGPFFHGVCSVAIGCRDKAHFVADMITLGEMVETFRQPFDYNDNDMHLIDLEYIDLYSDDMGNHEHRYVFDVFADKTE
ncbi:MAG: hypothetical protein NC083_08780 [Muribaculum sp.]|nr:hypothetical protein [Muribaculum sp.]MCM1577052.1 hypothetical protein [Bacteroides sp.]